MHRYLGSVKGAKSKPFLSTTLNYKTCTLFAINAIFTEDNNLSKPKVEGSLQKTNATRSKCKTNLILTYLHRSRRHSSSQSQKRESTILSDKNKLLPNSSSVNEILAQHNAARWFPAEKLFKNVPRTSKKANQYK